MVCFELNAIVGARVLSGQALPISFGGAAIAACNGLRYASSLKDAVHSECMHSSALSLTTDPVPWCLDRARVVMPVISLYPHLMVFLFFLLISPLYFSFHNMYYCYIFYPVSSLWTMSVTGW